MKIICQSCKKIIGEIEPLEDVKESKAKCSDCLKVEKDAEIKRLIEVPLDVKKTKDRVVTFENGAQGFLTIAGKETKKLGIWGVLFEGKEFFCCDETRKDFEKHLTSLNGKRTGNNLTKSIGKSPANDSDEPLGIIESMPNEFVRGLHMGSLHLRSVNRFFKNWFV